MIRYSGKQIIRAGDTLAIDSIAEKDPKGFEESMEILSYWRASYEEPLNVAVDLLTRSALVHDKKAVIAKRLKRTPSIINKLRRFKDQGMKLRTMQDIGGCRAILSNEKRVRKLVRDLKKKMVFRVKDYIEKPKDDGYRSIHLIGDFFSTNSTSKPIEIQVRTAAQHSWATAVEIIDLFTGQAIKSNQGSEDWHRFFRCAGDLFALIEDIPLYNSPKTDLKGEILQRLKGRINVAKQKTISENIGLLYKLGDKLGVLKNFEAFANSLKIADEHYKKESNAGYFLLKVDKSKQEITSFLYKEKNFSEAASDYLNAEKEAALSENLVVALVSTESVGGIKEAFPNYFADSTTFMGYISASMDAYRAYNPSAIGRALNKLFS
jgi:ppGpp synthetase/RelA/SpoT-type nucleotidyltranferase